MELKSLPSSTVRLIGSSQVITSIYSVVKELTENALDAESTSVEIKLENYGLDKVEVRDNGLGIKHSNIPMVAKRYHTSKITSFSDLENLVTYGFRGEALGSLCAVSDLSIISKTRDEEVSQCVTFDHHGNVTSTAPSHLGQGTTVCATHLFKNMPVRRQFYNTVKKKKEELKKVEDLLMSYGAIRPGVRLSLKHGKDLVWQKNVVPDVRAALFGILGRNIASQLQHKAVTCEESEVTIETYLPSPNSDVHTTSRSTPDRGFNAVNKRPVFLKDIDKVIRHHYCHHHSCENRYPVYFVSIECPYSELDVNLDPNKTQVMLHNKGEILAKLTETLDGLYGPITKPNTTSSIETDKSKSNGSRQPHDSVDINHTIDKQKFSIDDELHFTCIKRPENNSIAVGKDKDIKGTDKFSHSFDEPGRNNQILETLGSVEDQSKMAEESMDTFAGLTISFYDSDKTASSVTNDLQKEYNADLDQNANVSKQIPGETDRLANEMDCDIGLTQGAKGDFNLIDDEIDCLLVSQTNGKQNSNGLDDTEDAAETNKFNTNTSLTDRIQTLDSIEELPRDDQLVRTNSADWSKGQSERQLDGKTLEPVKLLVPDLTRSNKRPPSPTAGDDFLTMTPPSKKRVSHAQADQPRIYECVVNSNSDKFSAGFVAFSKQVRPKVVEENPSADYDTVTKIVQEKWGKLSDTNKQHFSIVGKEELQVLKKTVTEKKRLSQKIKPKSTVQLKPSLPSIKDQLLATSKPKDQSSPPIKNVRTHFNLENLKRLYNTGIRESQSQSIPEFHLLGPLKFYNAWVCCHGNKIQLLNPHRVEETLLYRELLDKHVLPASTLETPIRLNESNLGEDFYQTLLKLFQSVSPAQTYTMADEERLVANGIQVRQHINQDGAAVMDLVGLSKVMPMYGLTDLVEILDLITHTHATSLSMARPLKVINYLQGEAVRMVRQRPLQRSRDDVLDLLDQMASLPDNMVNCLHNKPFLHDVFDMKTTTSQSSSQSSS